MVIMIVGRVGATVAAGEGRLADIASVCVKSVSGAKACPVTACFRFERKCKWAEGQVEQARNIKSEEVRRRRRGRESSE